MEQKETTTKKQCIQNNRKWQKTFITNFTLLLSGIVMSISGLIIQYNYHLLKNPSESIVFAQNREEWNAIHVWSSMFFLLFAIYHVWLHLKWYKNVLIHKYFAKYRPTIVLTIITLLTATSGLIPLFILHFYGNTITRFSFIEIHDKVAILFFIIALRHTNKRFKWYIYTIKNKLYFFLV